MHTLGPWYGKTSSGGQGLIISEATGANVAVAYDDKDTQLIAAAPELLEALQEFLDCTPCRNGCAPNDMTCVSNQARAAINKALGR